MERSRQGAWLVLLEKREKREMMMMLRLLFRRMRLGSLRTDQSVDRWEKDVVGTNLG